MLTEGVAAGKVVRSNSFAKTCECPDHKINCLTAKEWLKNQIGVWEFTYEKRDVRDRKQHPATFPLALAKRCIALFTHAGELVVDPFCGSGTTLLAASDLDRNCFGFDINPDYVQMSNDRVAQRLLNGCVQRAYIADARKLSGHIADASVKLIVTSPPYAQALNRKRLNKSRRSNERINDQYLKVEQYSQRPEDLGTFEVREYVIALKDTFTGLKRKLMAGGHLVVNVADIWWENRRIPLHMDVIRAGRLAGLEFRNTIIWDRTNIVNRMGIFGWPNNYITMGTTFEYLLHFQKKIMFAGGKGGVVYGD